VLALAGLLATTIGVVSAITVLDSNDIGGASPWRSVLLSVLVSLMGFAALAPVHFPPLPASCRNGRRAILRLKDAPLCQV
jgi:hypothetical protein